MRSLRRSQASVDLAAELQTFYYDEDRISARRKYARPLEAYNERHRRINHFGIERADGAVATTPDEASGELVAHWAAVFGEGPDVHLPAAEKLCGTRRATRATSCSIALIRLCFVVRSPLLP